METNDPRRNRILRSLAADDYAAIVPQLRPVLVDRGIVLFGRTRPSRLVLFPLSGVTSLVTEGDGGEQAEAAMVGHDGVVGAKHVSSADGSVHAVQQVAGLALQIEGSRFETLLRTHPDLADLVDRHTELVFLRIAQSALCNRLHGVEQRAARWLLTSGDHVDGPSFAMTQEQLALTLGVQRPTVSSVAGTFRERGLIDYRYGVITLLDEERLRDTACGCYQALRDALDRLIPDPPGASTGEVARRPSSGRRRQVSSTIRDRRLGSREAIPIRLRPVAKT